MTWWLRLSLIHQRTAVCNYSFRKAPDRIWCWWPTATGNLTTAYRLVTTIGQVHCKHCQSGKRRQWSWTLQWGITKSGYKIYIGNHTSVHPPIELNARERDHTWVGTQYLLTTLITIIILSFTKDLTKIMLQTLKCIVSLSKNTRYTPNSKPSCFARISSSTSSTLYLNLKSIPCWLPTS